MLCGPSEMNFLKIARSSAWGRNSKMLRSFCLETASAFSVETRAARGKKKCCVTADGSQMVRKRSRTHVTSHMLCTTLSKADKETALPCSTADKSSNSGSKLSCSASNKSRHENLLPK